MMWIPITGFLFKAVKLFQLQTYKYLLLHFLLCFVGKQYTYFSSEKFTKLKHEQIKYKS